MKTLSLKLDDTIFGETEEVIASTKQSRNRYINEALAYYNKIQLKKIIASKLDYESRLVQEESMNILHEFEHLDYEG
jgi:hypothetical protein